MTEEERDDISDLLPKDPVIWADDEELASFGHANYRWWMDLLGHEKAHPGCCKTCGCATTCLAAAFHDSVVATTIRELDRIGALVKPPHVQESNTDASSVVSAGVEACGGVNEPEETRE